MKVIETTYFNEDFGDVDVDGTRILYTISEKEDELDIELKN